MAEVTNWHGSVWGGNTKGTAFAELTHTGTHFVGRFTVFEPGLGNFNARLDGEWVDNNHIEATLGEFVGEYSFPVTMPQNGRMDGKFDATEGVMTGAWNTSTPSSGKFMLMKMESAQPAQSAQLAQAVPQQAATTAPPPPLPAPPQPLHSLTTKTLVLRSYRLGEEDVRRLAEVIKSGANVLTPAINASHKGSEYIHVGLDAVMDDPSVPAVVYNMIIAANEPSMNLGRRTVILNLKQNDPSILFVSGDDKVWVEGKTAQIKEFLEYHESKTTHVMRNYGQVLNSIIFLAMLALLPSIQYLRQRVIVVVVAFALLMSLMYSWRLQANTKIFLREAKSTWYQKNSGTLLVLLEVTLTAVVAYLIHRFIGQ